MNYFSPDSETYSNLLHWIKTTPKFLKKSKHLPRLRGKVIEISGYENDFCDGFSFFCENLKRKLIDNFYLPAFKVRTLIRNTANYAEILREASKPYYLNSATAFFNFLKKVNSKQKRISYSEQQQLTVGDIPYFYIYTENVHLYDITGNCVKENYFKPTIEQSIRVRLDEPSEKTIDYNLRIVKQLVNYNYGLKNNFEAEFGGLLNNFLCDTANLKQIVYKIHSYLSGRMIYHNKKLFCCDLYYNVSGGFSIKYIQDDLYDGLYGVAVFYLTAYLFTNDIIFCKQFDLILKATFKDKKNDEVITFVSFPTSYVYLHLLEHIYLSRTLNRDFPDKYLKLVLDNIHKDEFVDITTGSASIINFLITNIKYFDKSFVENIIEVFIAKLVKGRVVIDEERVSWKFSDISNNLVGFSHGASGILYTLCNVYELKKEESIKDLIVKTYNYIKSLYNPAGGWFSSLYDNSLAHAGYNHGISGIGLAFLKLYKITNDTEVLDFLNIIVLYILKSIDTCKYNLANGVIGDLIIAKKIVESHNLALPTSTIDFFYSLEKSIPLSGLFIGSKNMDGFITCGLYTGLSGFGYGLINIFTDLQMPDVLEFKV